MLGMYLIMKKGKLRSLLSKAFNKAGNIRKLEKSIGISRSTLSAYHMEKVLVNSKNLWKLVKYLRIKLPSKEIIKELPNNWRQIKGGKKNVFLRKKSGKFEEQMKLCWEGSSRHMKLWHKKMKKLDPVNYYSSQFEKFKKVGLYKHEINENVKVRNSLERDVALVLEKLKINYEYEPLVRIGGRAFFPDFVIGNKIVIECTMWKGSDKAIKLKDKISYLEKKYKVYVIIPKTLNSHYQILNRNLVLGLDEFVPVAQTFRDVKSVRRGALGRARGC